MDATWCPSRRRLLASQLSVVALAVGAGCADGSGEAPSASEDQAADDESADDGDDQDAPTDETDDPDETDGADESSTDEDDPSADDADDGADGDPPDGSDPADLDLREANVVDVSFDGEDGTYTFDVTLHHDDDGEDGYANWWQVERLDGTSLGRRDLLHAHSQQPFTRSETIDVPEDVTCVVVRGHDQTHEYGGQVLLVDLDSEAVRAIDQGSTPQSFDESDCP